MVQLQKTKCISPQNQATVSVHSHTHTPQKQWKPFSWIKRQEFWRAVRNSTSISGCCIENRLDRKTTSNKASVKKKSVQKCSIRHKKNAPKTIKYKNRKYLGNQVQSFNAATDEIHMQCTWSSYTTHIEKKECADIVQFWSYFCTHNAQRAQRARRNW